MTISSAMLRFALVAALLTIMPSLDTGLVFCSSISRSRGYAYATAAGIQTGAMVWGVAAAIGATPLLPASRFA